MQLAEVNRILGIAHEEEENPKKITKAAAIAILKIYERPQDNIILFSDNFKVVGEEIKSQLGRFISWARFSDHWQIQVNGGGLIAVMNPEIGDKICGYRAHVLIVDGNKETLSDQILNECILPFMCITSDPQRVHELGELCGESIRKFARQNELIFTEGENLFETQ